MFNFYIGIPLVDIIRVEWNHLGPFHFLLAGLPASIAFEFLVATQRLFIDEAGDALISYVRSRTQNQARRDRDTKIIKGLGHM